MCDITLHQIEVTVYSKCSGHASDHCWSDGWPITDHDVLYRHSWYPHD